jgi:hypothetical protein
MDIDSLYQQHTSDPRPLPLIIADLWKFPLAYVEKDDVILYAVPDWITGIGQTDTPRRYWSDLRIRAKKQGVIFDTVCRKLPYRASDDKMYQMDYVDARTLFIITAHMSTTTGIATHVLNGQMPSKSTIAKSDHGYIYLLSFVETHGYYKIGKTQDIQRRINGISTNVPFTVKLNHVFVSQQAIIAERTLHRFFASKRIKLEWFSLESHDVDLIKSISSDDDLKRIVDSRLQINL